MATSLRTFAGVVLLLCFFTFGCSDAPEDAEQPAGEVSTFEAEGRVVRILENSRLLQIDHGDIDGFMPAMTMPFEYRSDSIRQAVSVGDSIHFTVSTDGIDNWITAISVIR